MATTKSQRLVNLVICLRSTTSYLSATQIRQMVQGYDDCENEAAFHRMFERDKKELREVGVPIAQGTSLTPNTPTGYRIAAAEYELPEITLTPEQAGVLAVAAEVWRAGSRGTDAELALGKLTAAGVEPVRDPATSVEVGDAHELATAAVVAEAVASGSALTFSYQAPGSAGPSVRSVEPWWTGSRDGRWYLVGHDRDRDAPRTFRLVRMADARVNQLRIDQVPRAQQPLVSQYAPRIAEQLLADLVIYRFPPEQLELARNLGLTVGALQVTREGLRVEMLPQALR